MKIVKALGIVGPLLLLAALIAPGGIGIYVLGAVALAIWVGIMVWAFARPSDASAGWGPY